MHAALKRFSPEAVAAATSTIYDREHPAGYLGYTDAAGRDILGNLLLVDFPEVYRRHEATSSIPGMPNALVASDALAGFPDLAPTADRDAEWERIFTELVDLIKLNDGGKLRTREQVRALLED